MVIIDPLESAINNIIDSIASLKALIDEIKEHEPNHTTEPPPTTAPPLG